MHCECPLLTQSGHRGTQRPVPDLTIWPFRCNSLSRTLACFELGQTMRRRAFIAGVGAATVWPFAVAAQQTPKVSRIGWLGTPHFDSPAGRINREAFLQGLRDLGYIEGQNIIIEYRMADGRIERLPELAAELVRLNVDLIVAGATPAGRAAQQATKAIPIIVNAMGDPVRDELVASLPRPGGNITGTTFLGPELVPKRLALLKEFLPRISRVCCSPTSGCVQRKHYDGYVEPDNGYGVDLGRKSSICGRPET